MDSRRTPGTTDDFEGEIIDIKPPGAQGRRKRKRWLLILVPLALVFALTRAASVYVETLWFGSLGYESVYWTTFGYEWAVFGVFALATTAVLRGVFWLLERSFVVSALAPRRIMLANQQALSVKPGRLLKNAREDVGFISLGYTDDIIGHIHVSWADPHKVREFVVVGSDARVAF